MDFNLPFENMLNAEFHLINEGMVSMFFYWKEDLDKYRVEFELDFDPDTGLFNAIFLTREETREVIRDMIASGAWRWLRGYDRFMG
jgi:hypothetical protein